MATAAIILAAAGALASAAGSYTQGQQQKKASEAQARFYEDQAEKEKRAAEVKAEQYRKEAERRMGAMRASYAYSGAESAEGTPLLTLMESAEEAARDEERIRRSGEDAAWGLLSQANISRIGGSSASTVGTLGAGASLLGGASRVASYDWGSK
jgi:uncharacterized protein HemX